MGEPPGVPSKSNSALLCSESLIKIQLICESADIKTGDVKKTARLKL